MPKYKLKPGLVDAEQWHPNNQGLFDKYNLVTHELPENCAGPVPVFLHTPQGSYPMVDGDYIVTYGDGTVRVLRQEVFEQLYARVEDYEVKERCRCS